MPLVRDPLLGNGYGSPNHTNIQLFIVVVYLLILYLVQRKGVLYKVKSKSRIIQITRSLALTTRSYVTAFLPRLRPLSPASRYIF